MILASSPWSSNVSSLALWTSIALVGVSSFLIYQWVVTQEREKDGEHDEAEEENKLKASSRRVEVKDEVTDTDTDDLSKVSVPANQSLVSKASRSQESAAPGANIESVNEFTSPAAMTKMGKELSGEGTKLYKEGKYEESLKAYTQAIEIYEKHIDKKEDLKVILCNRAATAERLKMYSQVENDCSAALKIDRKYIKAYKRRGKARQSMGDVEAALTDFVCIIVIQHFSGHEVDVSITSEVEAIQNAKVEKETKDALQNKANVPRSLHPTFFMQSYFASFHESESETPVQTLSVEELSKAIDDLTKSKNGSIGEKASLFFLRGVAYKNQKDYQHACEDFETASSVMKESNEYYAACQLEHGTFLHLRSDFDAATKAFSNCLKKNPKSIMATIRLAGLAFDQKNTEDALSWFKQSFSINPKSPTALYHRGQVHFLLGDVSSAMTDLNQCIEIAPDFAKARMQLGIIKCQTESPEAALNELLKAIQLSDVDPELYTHTGEAYLMLNSIDESMEMFDKAIAVDSSYPMSYVNKAAIQSNYKNDMPGAKLLLEKAIQESPQCHQAFVELAKLCLQLSEFGKAIQHVDRAIEISYREEELHALFGLRVMIEAQQRAHAVLSA